MKKLLFIMMLILSTMVSAQDTYVENNYYTTNDYDYSARLERFYGHGDYDYYSPYYTNGLFIMVLFGSDYYFHSYDPWYDWNYYHRSHHWYSYSYWDNSWYTPWNGYYGYGYYNYGYNNYGYYQGFGGHHGYQHGYNDGYNTGFNNGLSYNSNTNNGYYGPRGSYTSNSNPRTGTSPWGTNQPKPIINNTPRKQVTYDDIYFNPKDKPVVGKPSYFDSKPVKEEVKPVRNEPKPSYNEPKPSYNQPKETYPKYEPKPSYNQPKPSYNEPKPSYNQPKYEPKPSYNQPKQQPRQQPTYQSQPKQQPTYQSQPRQQPKSYTPSSSGINRSTKMDNFRR